MRSGATESRPLARTSELVERELAGETIVYDLEVHRAHCLNSTAAAVWRHCNGQNTLTRLGELAARDLGCAISDDVLLLTLNLLDRARLLDAGAGTIPTISRREVIKRAGMAAVAIPVIATVVAPPAAAQSSGNCPTCTLGGPGDAFCQGQPNPCNVACVPRPGGGGICAG